MQRFSLRAMPRRSARAALLLSVAALAGCNFNLPFGRGSGVGDDYYEASGGGATGGGYRSPAVGARAVGGAAALLGDWWLVEYLPSGPRPAEPAIIERLAGQPVRIDEVESTAIGGGRCPAAEITLETVALSQFYGYRPAAERFPLPEGSASRLRLFCGDRLFGDYLTRPDGTLLAPYLGGYFVLSRHAPEGAVRGAAQRSGGRHDPGTAAAAAPAASRSADTAPMSGQAALHLASDITEPAAAHSWKRLRAEHPELLGLKHRLIPTDIPGKGRYIRVYAIAERADAPRICAQIKKRGQYCAVMKVP